MLFPKRENVSTACKFTSLRPYALAPLCPCAFMSTPLCRRSLIACHLPKHKPPVCSRMTEWHVAIGDQRHTPAEPSRVYPEELGHVLFRNRQSIKEIFTVLPRFLDDLLQSEDLVRSTATRTKTALDNLQF